MRIAAAVELSPEQRQALERMARGRSLPARVVERARVVLLAADGVTTVRSSCPRRNTSPYQQRNPSRPAQKTRNGSARRNGNNFSGITWSK